MIIRTSRALLEFFYFWENCCGCLIFQNQSKLTFQHIEGISPERTDYWVSQGRKFCEFCKCSIADNKPSIQFHENGKKHKDNVAKRLTEMQKKAAKEAKDAVNFDREMKRVEAAALKAYMNDVKSNADYTSQLIQQGIETLPEPEIVPEPSKPKPKPFKRKPPPVTVTKKWMEALSEDGQKYYWNVETSESVWEPPEDYLSLEEQEKQKNKKPPKPPKHGKKNKKHGKNFSKFKQKRTEKKTEEEQEAKETKISYDPIPYVPPFGKWKKVEPPKEKKIDLQLPKQDWVEIVVPKLKEDVEKSFKEKTSTPGFVSSSSGEIGFKKRKIGADVKRNMRQRLDND